MSNKSGAMSNRVKVLLSLSTEPTPEPSRQYRADSFDFVPYLSRRERLALPKTEPKHELRKKVHGLLCRWQCHACGFHNAAFRKHCAVCTEAVTTKGFLCLCAPGKLIYSRPKGRAPEVALEDDRDQYTQAQAAAPQPAVATAPPLRVNTAIARVDTRWKKPPKAESPLEEAASRAASNPSIQYTDSSPAAMEDTADLSLDGSATPDGEVGGGSDAHASCSGDLFGAPPATSALTNQGLLEAMPPATSSAHASKPGSLEVMPAAPAPAPAPATSAPAREQGPFEEASVAPTPLNLGASRLGSAPIGGLDAFRPARKQQTADIGVRYADVAVVGLDAHSRLQRVSEESGAIRHVCATSRQADERAEASAALGCLSAALRRALRDPYVESQMSGDERRAVEGIERGAALASLCGFAEVQLRYDVAGGAGSSTAYRVAEPLGGGGGDADAANAQRLHATMLIRPAARSPADVALLRSVGQIVEASALKRTRTRAAHSAPAKPIPVYRFRSWVDPFRSPCRFP